MIEKTLSLGWSGESEVCEMLERIDDELYFVEDIYLELDDRTTQIDALVFHKSGLYVLEVKNIGGTVFADNNKTTWKVTNDYKVTGIHNPNLQNSLHIRFLRKIFGESFNWKSIVLFPDNTELVGDKEELFSFSDLYTLFKGDDAIYTSEELKNMHKLFSDVKDKNQYLCIKHHRQQERYTKR